LGICKTAEEVITTKRTFGLSERVTLKCATGQNEATVTKLSLKAAQNEQKRTKSRKLNVMLPYGWQRDLVEFSDR